MKHGCGARNVNQAVQTLPVLASHGTHDKSRRSNGKRKQDDPSGKAYLDEATLEDVIPDGGPDRLPFIDGDTGMSGANAHEYGRKIIAGEEEDIGRQMQRCVKERVKADEPAKADKPGDSRRDAAQRSNRQGNEKYPESPVSREVGDVGDGIGIKLERPGGVKVDEPEKWRDTHEMRECFKDQDGAF